MRKAWLGLALALPLVGLLGGIAMQEASLREATVRRIPITGYDPRDMLRGRYILFQYAWAVEGRAQDCDGADNCVLCLDDTGTRVRLAPRAAPGVCPAMIDPYRSDMNLIFDPLIATSRIFVSETRAPMLEKQLRDGPMVVVARLTRDGRLVNERLEPAR